MITPWPMCRSRSRQAGTATGSSSVIAVLKAAIPTLMLRGIGNGRQTEVEHILARTTACGAQGVR